MNQHELGGRLHALRLSRTEFAQKLGVATTTIYHWKEVPRYVVVILDLMERVHHLEGNMFKKKVAT